MPDQRGTKSLIRSRWLQSMLLPATVAGVAFASGLPHVPAGSASSRAAHRTQAAPGLTREQKTIHALDRFSFGPTPGQVALVERQGVERWFEQQVHPEQIPDDALAQRLSQYPAMQLSQQELIRRFPTPGLLRQYSTGALAVPAEDVERAVYADAAFRYQERRELRSAATVSTAPTPTPTRDSSASPRSATTDNAAPVAPQTRSRPLIPSDVNEKSPEVFSLGEREALLRLSPPARMNRLLALSPEEMSALHASLKGADRTKLLAGLSPSEMEEVKAMQAPERVVVGEVQGTRLLRDLYSQRQLQAVMTDFWLNHFNVFLHKGQVEPYLLPALEREAIRPNALGHFEDLLVATAKSPAMLVYLDNAASTGPGSRAALREARASTPGDPGAGTLSRKKGPKGLNENYARELMELHTLGVRGGYTQTDVIEVAKCFTGWTVDRPGEGGEFQFNPNRHEPGDKVVLGHTIQQAGMDEGLQVLHLLATHPATAHFVSLKLAQRFVSDTPPPSLVDRLSTTFLRSDGDIAAVLSTLFHSPEFWSPSAYRAKVKTPLEFTVSALRASGAEVKDPAPLVQALEQLGMPLYGMQTPNGYSSLAEDWISSNALLTRMNFALVLSGNRLGGTHVDWPSLVGEPANLAEAPAAAQDASEAKLERTLLSQPASPQTRAAVLNGAQRADLQRAAQIAFRQGSQGTTGSLTPTANPARIEARHDGNKLPTNPATDQIAAMAGLLLGSPEFQRR